MEAMLQAVKTVRPAFDAFYGSLDSEQEAHLDSSGPRRWGWQALARPLKLDGKARTLFHALPPRHAM